MHRHRRWVLAAALITAGDVLVNFIDPPPSLEGLSEASTLVNMFALTIALLLYIPVMIPRVFLQHIIAIALCGKDEVYPSNAWFYASILVGDLLVCLLYWALVQAARFLWHRYKFA